MKQFNSSTIQRFTKGQVILIALLIMAVVLVVALAIGTLMVRELKMSANIDRSVTAYFAAESGLEKAIWGVKKQDVGRKELEKDPYVWGEVLEGDGRWDLTFPTISEGITGELEKDKSEQVYFTADDPVKYVAFTEWVPDTIAWLEYKVVSWPTYDSTNISILFDSSQIITKEGLRDMSTVKDCINLNEDTCSCDLPSLPAKCGGTCYYYDHIFRFKPLKGGKSDLTSYTLTGYSLINCGGPEEVITGGKLVIKSTGTYSATKRVLQTSLYPTPPLHGIFDYVLFSDESIIK